MSVFGRRVTPEVLALELLRGFQSGDIVFDLPVADAPPPQGTLAPGEERLALLCSRLQALVGQAAELLDAPGESDRPGRGESLAKLKDEIGRVAKQLGAA